MEHKVEKERVSRSVERRRHTRFRSRCSIRFSPDGLSQVVAPTSNISCGGFHFLSVLPIAPETDFECDVVIPGMAGSPLVLRCVAQAVRITEEQAGLFGVACRVTGYTVIEADPEGISAAGFEAPQWQR